MLGQLASPPKFHAVASWLWVWLLLAGVLLLGFGLYTGLFLAPVDGQQGEVYRAIYVHVPAAWMSMFLYLVACGYAMLNWVYRSDVSAVMMRALLPTGAWMTALALITGALWGKPTWGAYWVWDARMTSELLLLFIYLGLIALGQLATDPAKADRVLAVGLLIGAVNIPLIYLSVVFWNTLHQGYSVSLGGSRIHPDIAMGMWLSVLGFWLICASTVLNRARRLLVQRRWQ
ncbi:MAG: heme ABC transporter permease CcmC [Gammaproteobacteria bacterium]|uniref:heme ABC transporter permease CcmC n=1 Tax=Limnobacter sp. TaxID=2003368 RepID=UPI001D22A9D7|nr:heme ABC transporter permease CcmC [Limnobacter sp.]MBU0782825.1 heme ABC transporter permease CcmC [Gammaproteobacteria bacterium]MBU0849412.1 heme ABC transporter permease CcmC [Gammaproteobacteria bacterium]MBU1266563.1 heme ABC transporter permease CcmC [Gammaproteobacteria bacterium]MBU1527760.1 heme ABC transporter permease CcmC [Gammaproteobacteria bacterium]MBU1779567.1 heme ABC transporter permease CcmC [Gammaproteobacteria bacterium]